MRIAAEHNDSYVLVTEEKLVQSRKLMQVILDHAKAMFSELPEGIDIETCLNVQSAHVPLIGLLKPFKSKGELELLGSNARSVRGMVEPLMQRLIQIVRIYLVRQLPLIFTVGPAPLRRELPTLGYINQRGAGYTSL